MLDALMLLVILRRDQCRDVERQPVQIHPMPAAGNLGHVGRAEIVDVELHRLLGILGFYTHVLDRKGYDRSPYRSPAARHDHDIALGQQATLSEAPADLAVNTAKEQRSYRRLPQ